MCANVQLKIETLQDAAKAGDVEAAQKLIEGGADVNGKDKRGITPLGVAVGFNKIAVVEELLARGADVEACDPKGNTALHYAAGTVPFARQLISVQLYIVLYTTKKPSFWLAYIY